MNMQKTFKLLVMTPEKEFLSGEVTHIIVSTPDGDMGIMADHMPIIAVVTESVLRVERDGAWSSAAIGQGFLDMTSDIVELFIDSAEWIEAIDVPHSEAASHRAVELLRGDMSHTEYLRTHTAVARATVRANKAKRK